MAIDLVNLIGSLGFPVAVASYLLLRFEKKLNENTEVMRAFLKHLELSEYRKRK